MTPTRVKLSRRPGARKPAGAVVVSRPSRWGNPYTIAEYGREQAVALYYQRLAEHPELVEVVRRELARKDLACWCDPDELCHADVLLEVANGGRSHEVLAFVRFDAHNERSPTSRVAGGLHRHHDRPAHSSR
jgi:uncharacterized protein DUF4326